MSLRESYSFFDIFSGVIGVAKAPGIKFKEPISADDRGLTVDGHLGAWRLVLLWSLEVGVWCFETNRSHLKCRGMELPHLLAPAPASIRYRCVLVLKNKALPATAGEAMTPSASVFVA